MKSETNFKLLNSIHKNDMPGKYFKNDHNLRSGTKNEHDNESQEEVEDHEENNNNNNVNQIQNNKKIEPSIKDNTHKVNILIILGGSSIYS